MLGVFASGHDVTRQKEAREVAQHVAAIVRNSDDAILSGSLEGIITSWNPAAERMYGYSSEEIVGKSIDLIIPDDRRGEVADILARIEAGEQVVRLETVRVRKDGTALPVSLTITAIRDLDGTVVGTSAIHRDPV